MIPSVGLAVLAAALALPQPTLPRYLPLPTLAPEALDVAKQRLLSDAMHARVRPLSYEVRSLGERFRQIGRAAHGGVEIRSDERERFRAQVRQTLEIVPIQEVRELRAVQTELFVQALTRFEKSSQSSEDLEELGGDFLELATSKGWVRLPNAQKRATPRTLKRTTISDSGAVGGAQLLLSEDEIRAAFLLRWTDFAGLFDHPEFRLEPSWVVLASRRRLRVPVERMSPSELAVIERLGEVSPEYPAALARGILLGHLGAYGSAAASFREHLRTHGEGDFSLRARNHLLYVEGQENPRQSVSEGPPWF
jgi:hypothetical protein